MLQSAGALSLTSLTPVWVTGCGDDGLPVYTYDGPLGPETLFEHGVASGDPLSDGVVLWTRVSPDGQEPVEVWWEIAEDTEFTLRVAQGTVMTDSDADYTAKVDVRGLGQRGLRTYYYRFFALGRQSSIGRTRLAPSGAVDRLRFGVASCASLAHGYFHAYRHMAARADLDVVLHLGDYIYEYGDAQYPSPDDPEPQQRLYEPSTEIVSLGDYRMRYSQYRRDPDLQLLHQQIPFIVVWDDHESANNSWTGGAENHTEGAEGTWTDRQAAAAQAYFEWMPIRDNPMQQIYRKIAYGDLVDLLMLDTRIAGREEPTDALVVNATDPDLLPQHLLGEAQESWLQEQLLNSEAQWKILGQQVVMGLWKIGTNSYGNADQWNGYPAARNRLLDFITDNNMSDVVVLTGDVHSSWAMDVTRDDGSYDADTGAGSVAVEFVGPGITSPPPSAAAFIPEEQNPHWGYQDLVENGYFVLDVTPQKAQADWYFVDGLAQDEGDESFGAAWATMAGTSHRIEMMGPEASGVGPELAPTS